MSHQVAIRHLPVSLDYTKVRYSNAIKIPLHTFFANNRTLLVPLMKLLCYVRGDESRYTFIVNINEDKTVSELRDTIKEKKSPKFDDIPADSLLLWKASVSVPINRDLRKCVEALNLVDDDSLYSHEILSDIFSSGLEEKTVHIIIERSHSGELQLHVSNQ
jgi:hypothetical protein